MVEPELAVTTSIQSRDSDKRKSLLDEVQLDSESEDNRPGGVTDGGSPKDRLESTLCIYLLFIYYVI